MEMVERTMPRLRHDDILGQRATGGAASLRGGPLGPAHQGRQYKGQPKHVFSGHHDIPFLIKVIEDGGGDPSCDLDAAPSEWFTLSGRFGLSESYPAMTRAGVTAL